MQDRLELKYSPDLQRIAGVEVREIPPEEMELRPEQVERLATKAGGAFGEWIREFYSKYLPKTK